MTARPLARSLAAPLAMIGAMIGGRAVWAGSDDASEPPVIEVVDESGAPVEAAEYIFFAQSGGGFTLAETWRFVSEHPRIPEGVMSSTSLTVLAVAPGLAWDSATVDPQQHDGPIRLTLSEGRAVAFTLNPPDGRELPDTVAPVIFDPAHCLPICYAASHDFGADADVDEASRRRTPGNAVRTGERTFEVRVPEDAESVGLFLDEPGFLRAFSAMGLPLGDAPFTIDLPEPATLRIDIGPSESAPAEYDRARYRLSTTIGCEMPLGVYLRDETSRTQRIRRTHDDLAPGMYAVYAKSGREGDPDYYESNLVYRLTPEDPQTAELSISTFDGAHWREKLSASTAPARLTFVRDDGSPAAGASYRLVREFRHYGTSIEIASGRADASGVAEIPALPTATFATVYANGAMAGYAAESGAERLDDGTLAFEYTAKGTPTGERAPDLPLRDVRTGELFSLGDFRGKVVLVDVWASWCGPCMPVMRENNELAQRRTDWEGKAVIIGASIDDTIQQIREHLDAKKWYAVRQMHIDRDNEGELPDAYGAIGNTFIPHAVLIDRDGMIVKQGSPGSFDPESEIDRLLEKSE